MTIGEEMLSNGNKKCPFTDAIVSYIYNELDAPASGKFETHLADCVVCTDEFAAIANARFSVFEWQKEEFAHLANPAIIIPYPAKQNIVAEDVSVGFLAGIRGILSISRWPVAVAATVLVCLGLGFLAMTYIGRVDQIAVNPQSIPPVITKDDPVKIESPDIKDGQKTFDVVGVTPLASNKTRPARAVEYKRAKSARQMTADTQKPVNNIKAPVLSSYDEVDDKSLRLTDLFDDGDSGR